MELKDQVVRYYLMIGVNQQHWTINEFMKAFEDREKDINKLSFPTGNRLHAYIFTSSTSATLIIAQKLMVAHMDGSKHYHVIQTIEDIATIPLMDGPLREYAYASNDGAL